MALVLNKGNTRPAQRVSMKVIRLMLRSIYFLHPNRVRNRC